MSNSASDCGVRRRAVALPLLQVDVEGRVVELDDPRARSRRRGEAWSFRGVISARGAVVGRDRGRRWSAAGCAPMPTHSLLSALKSQTWPLDLAQARNAARRVAGVCPAHARATRQHQAGQAGTARESSARPSGARGGGGATGRGHVQVLLSPSPGAGSGPFVSPGVSTQRQRPDADGRVAVTRSFTSCRCSHAGCDAFSHRRPGRARETARW